MTDIKALAAAFQAADDDWTAELTRIYGAHAGDVRYTRHGRGDEGTKLRALWEARAAASDRWTHAKQFA